MPLSAAGFQAFPAGFLRNGLGPAAIPARAFRHPITAPLDLAPAGWMVAIARLRRERLLGQEAQQLRTPAGGVENMVRRQSALKSAGQNAEEPGLELKADRAWG